MDLALCTGAQSCWNRKGPFPNCSHKVGSMQNLLVESYFQWNRITEPKSKKKKNTLHLLMVSSHSFICVCISIRGLTMAGRDTSVDPIQKAALLVSLTQDWPVKRAASLCQSVKSAPAGIRGDDSLDLAEFLQTHLCKHVFVVELPWMLIWTCIHTHALKH